MQSLQVLILFFILIVKGSESAKFIIKNQCASTIWPATLSGGGTPALASTGFQLANGATFSLDAPLGWSGRVWARTSCSTQAGRFRCDTGDCGSGSVTCYGAGGAPPASLVEFTLAKSNNNDQDFYDVSLVDGFNLPVSVTPQGGSGAQCKQVSCSANLNSGCPGQLALHGPGGVIGCRSACLVFNQPQYCCTGAYGSPSTCPPTSYSTYFKNRCPQAYSYAYDDKTSTFTCSGGPNYLITFCP